MYCASTSYYDVCIRIQRSHLIRDTLDPELLNSDTEEFDVFVFVGEE